MNHKYKKYLDKKSVHLIWPPNYLPEKKLFDFIISIPCYDEYEYLFKTLDSINKQDDMLLKKSLVSIAINNSNKENQKIINNNKRTYNKLVVANYKFEMLIIDAFSENKSLDEKEAGVGLARKIAVDNTLDYSHSNSIICFIDADTELSNNYLTAIHSSYIENQWNSATVNFRHSRDEPRTNRFIDDYENFLKETASNLKNSASPYSYVPLGSTMICTKGAYIAVGGMNKRKAAEDFYFLQELEKTFGVYYLSNVLVHPSSRYLNRSYLGTSTRLKKCLDGDLDIASLFYSSKSFGILNKWIHLALKSKNETYLSILEKSSEIDKDLSDLLIKFNFKKAWIGISTAPSLKHFEKQFHRWFDAFKTLKLLKYYS